MGSEALHVRFASETNNFAVSGKGNIMGEQGLSPTSGRTVDLINIRPTHIWRLRSHPRTPKEREDWNGQVREHGLCNVGVVPSPVSLPVKLCPHHLTGPEGCPVPEVMVILTVHIVVCHLK